MTNRSTKTLFLIMLIGALASIGCTGSRTFHEYARAGDTVAVGAGWAHHMQRGNIEVTITDAGNNTTTYTPGQPGYEAVRGSINFYPDPVSGLVLSERLNADVTPSARTYSDLIKSESTSNDLDWWETVVFVDLPSQMALGEATVVITDIVSPANETTSATLTIVPDENGLGQGGTPNSFLARLNDVPPLFEFNVADSHFQSMERVDHYVVTFSGNTIPQAIQVELTHDPDAAHSGSGTPYVVNPIGDVKNLSWSQTGTNGTDLRVIMIPARDGSVATMNDFKFYVAGGVTGLAVVDQDTNDPGDFDVLAFDGNGNPIADVTATIASSY
jgi:hypothetical protein